MRIESCFEATGVNFSLKLTTENNERTWIIQVYVEDT